MQYACVKHIVENILYNKKSPLKSRKIQIPKGCFMQQAIC